MDPIAVNTEPHPTRAHWIVRPRRNDAAVVRISWVRYAALDGESAHRTWGRRLAHRDRIGLDYFAVFNQCQLAIFEAHNDHAFMGRHWALNLRILTLNLRTLICCGGLGRTLCREHHYQSAGHHRRHRQSVLFQSLHRIPQRVPNSWSAYARKKCKRNSNRNSLKLKGLTLIWKTYSVSVGTHCVWPDTPAEGRLERRTEAKIV